MVAFLCAALAIPDYLIALAEVPQYLVTPEALPLPLAVTTQVSHLLLFYPILLSGGLLIHRFFSPLILTQFCPSVCPTG